MVTPAAVREAVAHVLREHDVSERRACSIVGADRSTIRYRSRLIDDALLRGRLRELATERRRSPRIAARRPVRQIIEVRRTPSVAAFIRIGRVKHTLHIKLIGLS